MRPAGRPGPRALFWRLGALLLFAQVAVVVAGAIWGAWAALALALALTAGVAWVASRRVGGAVSRLAEAAGRFAAGDLRHRVTGTNGGELLPVVDAFNRMADRLEAELSRYRTQQLEQEAILQSMGNGVLALDAEHRVLSLNRAGERLLGLDGAASRGRLLEEVLREPPLHEYVADAMARPRRTSRELVLGGETPRTIQVEAEPLMDESGRGVGLLMVLNDITQLRRLEMIRSDFAANVSHELQTPITAIKGYIETLQDGAISDQEQARRFLGIVARNADRLAAIIEDLLALARLEEPDTTRGVEKTRNRVATVVESVVGEWAAAAAEKDVALKTELHPELAADFNAQLIEQALSNLISNAIKFSRPHTAITITAAPDDGGVTLTVADHGPGIEPEHLPRLFERFYRVDRARSRQLGGTGLGLAIVKHIAMVHGGRTEVESEVGEGSAFRIVLPAG